MKFGKEWERETLQMPPHHASSCLDYRTWKRRIKQGSGGGSLARELISDVARVDAFFRLVADPIIDRHGQRRSSSGRRPPPVPPPERLSCRTRVHPDDSDAKARAILAARSLAALNRRCLYKVCKRMDRFRLSFDRELTAMAWLTDVRRRHAFDFLGGLRVACLDVLAARAAEEPPECPICFSPLPDAPGASLVVVTRCGHYFCAGCVDTALGVAGRRGSARNLEAWAQARGAGCASCPMCRDVDGLVHTRII